MRAERTVVFVVFDGFQLLDLAGPVEVLRSATLMGVDPGYRTLIASPGGHPVRTESGVSIGADVALEALAHGTGSRRIDPDPIDMVVVVGGFGAEATARDPEFLAAVSALSRRARRTASVCSGAFILGAAGLLDGYRATTHWNWCDRFAERCPGVDVAADQIYVHDRDRWTSAGVTAGIDLFLGILEHDHGREVAHTIARWLVVFVRRPGGQAQFSAQLRAQSARSPVLDELQRWLPDHLDDDLSVASMARRCGMSPRHFARSFAAETGTTPAAHVEELRVEAARRLLETTDLTVSTVARRVGIRRAETLYRSFRRRLGTTPERYRQHFGLQAS